MLRFRTTDSSIKNTLVAGAALLLLAACGETSTSAKSTASTGQSEYEVPGDHAIGNADAKATVVEYASVVCPACSNWHTAVYPDFKKKYVDSGKVRFVFREFPTPPENLARAGFLIANCAGEDKFMENISLQFKRQKTILQSSDIRQEYVNIAKAAGMSEADFEACMVDKERNERYEAVVQGGIDAGVTGTPAFFINGEKVKIFTLEQFDEKLAPILGEDMPVDPDAEPTNTDAVPADTDTTDNEPTE